MKHYLPNSLRELFLSLAVLLSLPMLAEKVEIDGISYDLDAEAKQATVIEKSSDEYFGKVVIPESVEHDGIAYSVTSIGEEAFENCDGLTSITIPNSVMIIGGYAFYDCEDLASVTIGNSIDSIGYGAFLRCPSLTSVHISDIAAWCNIEFHNYKSNPLSFAQHLYINGEEVKELVIPNGVTSIGSSAFMCWLGLTSVVIPNSVESIGLHAFDGCTCLASVTIGNSVKSIGEYAFYDCSGLTSVTIGNSVESIGEDAFASCINISDVYCHVENVPATESDVFFESGIESSTLLVPAGAIESYKTTEPWSSFGKLIALTEEETGINELKDENGKLNSAVYDLSGRRVQKAQKGIFIQNGKVVMVR